MGASDVEFIADDKGELSSALGLLFDASGLLGGPRIKVRGIPLWHGFDLMYLVCAALRHHRRKWFRDPCCGRRGGTKHHSDERGYDPRSALN